MVPIGILWLCKLQVIKGFHVGIELRQERFVSSLPHCLHELDRQMQPS